MIVNSTPQTLAAAPAPAGSQKYGFASLDIPSLAGGLSR